MPYLDDFEDFFESFEGLDMGAATSVLSAVIVSVIIIVCIASLIGLLTYIFESLAIYTMAKRRGISSPWLSWVPVANTWAIGSVADQYEKKASGQDKGYRKKLLAFTIVTLVLSPIISVLSMGLSVGSVLGGADFNIEMSIGIIITMVVFALAQFVIGILLTVYTYIVIYKVYRSCKPDTATLLTVLSIFFNIVIPFALFALRNKDGGFEEIRDKEQAGQAAQSGSY